MPPLGPASVPEASAPAVSTNALELDGRRPEILLGLSAQDAPASAVMMRVAMTAAVAEARPGKLPRKAGGAIAGAAAPESVCAGSRGYDPPNDNCTQWTTVKAEWLPGRVCTAWDRGAASLWRYLPCSSRGCSARGPPGWQTNTPQRHAGTRLSAPRATSSVAILRCTTRQ